MKGVLRLRIPRRVWGLFAISLACVLTGACSQDTFETRVKARLRALPRRFELNGKGYVLDDKEAGVISDDDAVYTSDAGARMFNYRSKLLLRQLFVGTWHTFDSLPIQERQEIDAVAKAVLDHLHKLERRGNGLVDIDRRHREVLKEYIANHRWPHP